MKSFGILDLTRTGKWALPRKINELHGLNELHELDQLSRYVG